MAQLNRMANTQSNIDNPPMNDSDTGTTNIRVINSPSPVRFIKAPSSGGSTTSGGNTTTGGSTTTGSGSTTTGSGSTNTNFYSIDTDIPPIRTPKTGTPKTGTPDTTATPDTTGTTDTNAKMTETNKKNYLLYGGGALLVAIIIYKILK
jgi:hypothetical protein